MDSKIIVKRLVGIAKELTAKANTKTFKCPDCGSKVLEQTGYCVKCQKKVKKASRRNADYKKANIKTAEKMTVNGVKVWISTSGKIQVEVFESYIELLLDALKVKGKLRNIKRLDIYATRMRGQNIEFVVSDATTADHKVWDFTATIIQSGSNPKVKINSLELASETELSVEARTFIEEFGEKAAEDILSDMGYELSDIEEFEDSIYTHGAYDLKVGGEEYLGFKNVDEAETHAINYVREDLEDNSEIFNQGWLMGHVNLDAAESFFRQVYDEWNYSYAEDIQSESSSRGYDSRLDDELVERGIVEEDDVIWTEDDAGFLDDEDEAEELKGTLKDDWDASDHIDAFVENMTQDQIDEGRGQGGLSYYESNFGEEEAKNILKENNLIDLDAAAQDAVNTDGIAHFLANYDGNEIEGMDGSVWYRQN